MRGRALGFILIMGAAWVAVRIGTILLTPPETEGADYQPVPIEARRTRAQSPAAARPVFRKSRTRRIFPLAGAPVQTFGHPDAAPIAPESASGIAASMTAGATARRYFAAYQGRARATLAQHPVGGRAGRRAPDIYAYSFWRSSARTAAALGSGQYGGSQSAIIAAYPLLYYPEAPRLAIIARAAIAHGNGKADGTGKERELAAGFRWRPLPHMPVQFIAERRFRPARADALAFYLAGGQSAIGLPLGFKLDGYGQAGFLAGNGGGAFADFNARADRPLASLGRFSLAAGVGIWGGGQADAIRVDIGPTVRADIAVATVQFRLTADWRFRAAGNAQPGNGPAIGLSTSF